MLLLQQSRDDLLQISEGPVQITISMFVGESDWLRFYAAHQSKLPEQVAAAAIERARLVTERPDYIEPGTSITRRGVVEVDLMLEGVDAQWVMQRAMRDRVTTCAVLGATLRSYREVAPALARDPGWATAIGGQTLLYRRIDSISKEVSSGKISPDEADEQLASAVAIRLYGLLPDVARDDVRRAATAAVRELCVNHPGVRASHGREK